MMTLYKRQTAALAALLTAGGNLAGIDTGSRDRRYHTPRVKRRGGGTQQPPDSKTRAKRKRIRKIARASRIANRG